MHLGHRGSLIVWAFLIGIVATLVFRSWAHRQQEATGRQYPIGWIALGLIVVLPLLVYFVTGRPISFVGPEPSASTVQADQIFP